MLTSTKTGSWFTGTLWMQWIAGISTFLMLMTIGLKIGWTSPYTAQLMSADSPLPLTTDEVSWVASLMNVGRLLGAIFGCIGVEWIGRKRTLTIVGFPMILAWICIIVADSVAWLYASRLLAGLSLGISFSSFPIFLGEISSPKIRGTLVTLSVSGMAVGTLTGNIMGANLSMTIFSYISLVPNVCFVLLFLWLSESPHFLVRDGKTEDAMKSIIRYNPNVDPEIEYKAIRNYIESSGSPTIKERLREFNIPENKRAMIITIVLYFFMQFSGMNSIIYYLETVLTSAGVNVIQPSTLVIINSGASVLTGWVAVYIADKFRRKVLMIFSSVGVSVTMLVLGVHFALLDNGFDPDSLQWLPITTTILFMISFCVGMIGVPSMILSELFAPNIKSVAAGMIGILSGVFAFGATKSYQPLIDTVGEAWVYWLHALLMIFCTIFSAVWIPETKGKSLQEIQNLLMKK
ncbi:facilitated trehalose transporter Tret1-like [Neodiprion pinetum]|uniref:facilitated trehalose transporter Tret1-like n=1 Tax=Neodiprion pinetum TaxID=441929 RepID=UPI001EDE9CD9|nr:facilitated trehalose transporter Tret1-like [Neodiprion pinetum]